MQYPMRPSMQGNAHQRGLSLVELMVGITVGLFVVAAATALVTSQLTENRRLLLETQLQQDLRASADIITRELRRSGSWAAANETLWYPGSAADPSMNPFSSITVAGDQVDFSYQRSAGNEGPYGFRLSSSGVIQTRLAGAGWQDLTDGNVMDVSGLDIVLTATQSERIPCPRVCDDDGSTACWPQAEARTLQLTISARSRTDPTVTRDLTTAVRLRNDRLISNNGASLCP
ncbi:MAG: prepilin-type N-terminal cleavage/methylation domain-containing protein [Rubrivivax sp.]|nr:prepilin-type N-terminal cleavage/methylation domain-containing protein [Rubrivivax sp.]